jgi:peptidoglycan-associated lipoprotein
MDRKAAILAANPAVRLTVAGHADERGSDEYNLALGMRRAGEARRYLIARGIQEARLTVTSEGEERPTCRETDESCWARNRRDEFAVAGGDVRAAPPR